MALIAVDAVVHIAASSPVGRVHLRLRVAYSACKDGVVRRIRMAIAARSGISMGRPKPGMSKGCTRPCGCGVACCAAGREAGSLMPWIGCAVEIREVAGNARHREAGIDFVLVAGGTLSVSMRSRKDEGC